jgi:hypothetical protein
VHKSAGPARKQAQEGILVRGKRRKKVFFCGRSFCRWLIGTTRRAQRDAVSEAEMARCVGNLTVQNSNVKFLRNRTQQFISIIVVALFLHCRGTSFGEGGSHKCPTKTTRFNGSSQKSAYSADARLCQIAQFRFVAVLYAPSGVRSSSRKSAGRSPRPEMFVSEIDQPQSP